ncbi:Uncharacterized protein involved in exopolysaccharide biosynthesis [Tistlia consotensis]|uniref:Uncharacterized protein involved in exopolysaccharide biosynthesis n=1 Tax=Tistlia consotensis USBA 355 TaxID=560819 RepID=A0A1Y6CKA4_9PROT|nr:Wzz/FepE/Etk N-terminal domain-containing protein [Tistlia consotensis]SMF59123.1 Uncharacterized protein involved in exopolysaccharide biosynthesis [Tistlia consotensis USBA 355]SNR64146.1 Uncharacterized protein involved in exopolysaccharide biosynthesis [Tistlia consotensis]
MPPREPYLLQVPAGAWPPAGPATPAGAYAPAGGDGMEFFRKLWRCKWLVLGAAAAGGLLAAGVSTTLEPRYSAESQVLIGAQVPKVTQVPDVLQELSANQEVVQSESYVLQSRGLAAEVARRLALDRDPEFNPALRPPPPWWRQQIARAKDWLKTEVVKPLLGGGSDAAAGTHPEMTEAERRERLQQIVVSQLLSRLEVSPLQRSHVLAIDVQSESPETAARVANGLADTYIEQQLARRATATADANQWLDKRIAELRRKVEESERAVAEYRRANGLYETRSDEVTAQQVSELNTQLILAESAQAEADSRLAQAQKVAHDKAPPEALPEVLSSPLIQALKTQQTDLQRQAAELASTYGPQHPKMLDMKAQLADIRGKVAAEVGKVVEGLRHEDAAARARATALRKSLDQVQAKMGQTNEKSIRLHELERQAESNRRLLVSFLDREKEVSDQPDGKDASSVVISRAAVPLSPSYPPSTMLVLLGLIGGTLIGILVGLVRENMDRSFRTAQQLEDATNLPTLGMLPPPGRRSFAGVQDARRSNSPFGHAIGNLFERLVFAPQARARKVLMLTSATPREGKSRIAASLIRMATGSGLRVIILDCDWRRPAVHDYFAHAMAPGLGDLLAGAASAEDVVFHDGTSGAHAIFAGDVSRIANGALRYERLRLLLTTLARHYDLVILDAPPVLAGSEAAALAQMAEEVAFVVRWGSTPRAAVVEALNHLEMAGARLGGTILSDVDPKGYRRYGTGEAVYGYAQRPVTRAA